MNFKCDICGLYIPKKPAFFYLNRKKNAFFPLCSNCEKKIRNQLPSYNDILFNADIRETLKNLIFEEKFKIDDFFNLCIISESIILYKNLFTYNPYTVELLNSEFFPEENSERFGASPKRKFLYFIKTNGYVSHDLSRFGRVRW